jgi:hypothetical protein
VFSMFYLRCAVLSCASPPLSFSKLNPKVHDDASCNVKFDKDGSEMRLPGQILAPLIDDGPVAGPVAGPSSGASSSSVSESSSAQPEVRIKAEW